MVTFVFQFFFLATGWRIAWWEAGVAARQVEGGCCVSGGRCWWCRARVMMMTAEMGTGGRRN